MNYIKNNGKMTPKNTGTLLFLACLVAVSLLFGTSHMPHADAKASPTDTTDYFAQAVVTFEETKKLDQEIAEDEKRIKGMEVRLVTTFDKIERMLILSEMEQVKSLKSAKESKVMVLQNEINQLEQKNIQANTVDSTTEQNYIAIEKVFYAKYVDEASAQFVGDNPVEGAYVDAQFKDLVVLANPTQIRDGGLDVDLLVSEYENAVSKMPGYDLTVKMELTEFVNVACSTRDARCNPVYGGLSVSNEDEVGIGFSTMSYKAKLGNTIGFVMTAHGAGGSNNDIVQPDDVNRVIGNVDAYQNDSDCDCAFVDIGAYAVDNEIYKNKSTSYNVTGHVADSSQSKNTWVYKSGAKTGVTLGKITSNIPSSNINLIRIYLGPGDSGSPVFKTTSGNNVDLYGMIYRSSSSTTQIAYAYYYPWDHINSELGTSLP